MPKNRHAGFCSPFETFCERAKRSRSVLNELQRRCNVSKAIDLEIRKTSKEALSTSREAIHRANRFRG
jgi:hypothetical protein